MIPVKDLLDAGNIEPLVAHLREIAVAHSDAPAGLAQEILKEAEYFATNASWMRYPEFREKGFFVGSGVVEAGCKSVIGSRLKRSGMFWTVRGPTLSSPCAAVASTGGSRITGSRVGLPDQSILLTSKSHTRPAPPFVLGARRKMPAVQRSK
jgi:hypothetical protein